MQFEATSELLKEAGLFNLGLGVNDAAETGGDPGAWGCIIAGNPIFVDIDAARNAVILRSDVGFAPPGSASSFFALLLRFNAHAAETGMYLAIDNEDGQVLLMAEFLPEKQSRDGLHALLFEFEDRASAWRQFIAESGLLDSDTQTAPTVPSPTHFA